MSKQDYRKARKKAYELPRLAVRPSYCHTSGRNSGLRVMSSGRWPLQTCPRSDCHSHACRGASHEYRLHTWPVLLVRTARELRTTGQQYHLDLRLLTFERTPNRQQTKIEMVLLACRTQF